MDFFKYIYIKRNFKKTSFGYLFLKVVLIIKGFYIKFENKEGCNFEF